MTPQMKLSLHECGHAIAVFLELGRVDKFALTQRADGTWESDCSWQDLVSTDPRLPDAWAELFALECGPAATQHFDATDPDPWGRDSGDNDYEAALRCMDQLTAEQCQFARSLAQSTIAEHHGCIRALAEALVQRGRLDNRDIEDILGVTLASTAPAAAAVAVANRRTDSQPQESVAAKYRRLEGTVWC